MRAFQTEGIALVAPLFCPELLVQQLAFLYPRASDASEWSMATPLSLMMTDSGEQNAHD